MSGKCKYCGDGVGFENWEAGYDFCDWCADIEIEKSRRRAEWREYHDEPMPDVELSDLPQPRVTK
jgi:hypothetical protein